MQTEVSLRFLSGYPLVAVSPEARKKKIIKINKNKLQQVRVVRGSRSHISDIDVAPPEAARAAAPAVAAAAARRRCTSRDTESWAKVR